MTKYIHLIPEYEKTRFYNVYTAIQNRQEPSGIFSGGLGVLRFWWTNYFEVAALIF